MSKSSAINRFDLSSYYKEYYDYREAESRRWTGGDLNPRPPACKAGILPLNYQPIVWTGKCVDFNCCLYVAKILLILLFRIYIGVTKIRSCSENRRQCSRL